ncbi:MAG: phage holin family protein [Zoogloeaceae bacterium]|nr:phage holin family protein [Zoogloeaceae bacterium]
MRNTAGTLLATVHSRIALAGNELETERLRLVRSLLLGIAALFCLGLGVLLLVGLVLALHWESRVLILVLFGAGFLIAGALLLLAMRSSNGRRQVFEATIAELEEDLRQLRAATAHDNSPD